MSAPRRNAHTRAWRPAAMVCVAALCQCSFVGLDGLDNGGAPDAATGGPSDAALSDRLTPSDGPTASEGAVDAFIGSPDVVETGTVAVDSADEDAGNVADADIIDSSTDATREAATDAASTPPEAGDASPADAGPPCDPAKPFGPPILLTGLQSVTSRDGTLRLLPNELTGYFWSSRPGGPGSENLYVSMRPDMKSPFGAPVLLNNVNLANQSQYEPTVTFDGLHLAFRSGRDGGVGGSDIYWASRTDTQSDFANVRLLGYVNSPSNDVQPFVGGVPNGTELYFASNRAGDYDLYRATGGLGTYSNVRAIQELNLGGGVRDEQPIPSDSDLTVFFSSSRTGGLGANDIWMATRATNFSNFSPPTNLTTVNTTAMDYPDWVSSDGCRLYLSSDISGLTRLYVATRPM